MIYPVVEDKEFEELLPRYQYYFRVLLSFSASAALIGKDLSDENSMQITTLAIAGIMMIYCAATYWYTLVRNKDQPTKSIGLAIADGFIIMLAITELDYSPWPSILLLTLLQFNALSQGGIRQAFEVNTGVILGLITGFFLLENQVVNLEPNSTLNNVVLIGAFAYLCIYGASSYQYLKQLIISNAVYKKDSETYRVQVYKLSHYIPGPVTAMIRDKNHAILTERKRITVFFSDIVGFTELSEELEAETLAELLNNYLSEMSKVANRYNGTVDKFMGDAIMILFGDDIKTSKGIKKDAIKCVAMALEMSKRMQELQAHWSELGIKKPLQIRIGINSGYCTVGTFGTDKNLDYTALGASVNLASRLESAGKPGEILISHETWALIKDVILCKDNGQIKAKGFSYPIQVYQVIDFRKNLAGKKSYLSETMEGFSMHLDLEKIKNYDQDQVIDKLEAAAEILRNKKIH
jgi:class 3 adenylate cyclase